MRAGIVRVVRAYGSKPLEAAIGPNDSSQQLTVFSTSVQNRSGSAIDCGIAKIVSKASWRIYTSLAGVITDVTALIQAGTPVEFFTANNDALFIGSRKPFSMLGLNVSTADTGAPVYATTFYNGSSFATLTQIETLPSLGTTGEKLVVFIPPYNWARGGNASLDSSLYYIRIQSTTAPTTEPLFNVARVYEMLKFHEALADNSSLEIASVDSDKPLTFESGEGLVPYFGTANAANLIDASYVNLG